MSLYIYIFFNITLQLNFNVFTKLSEHWRKKDYDMYKYPVYLLRKTAKLHFHH